jgi:predicted nucleic acid-binding protein
MDAWNDACAEQLQVEALITCDERMIKRYKGNLTVINPVTFTMEFLQADKY